MRPASSPEIRRRKSGKVQRWVFLLPEMWKELSEVARFATRAFALTDKPETVSRQDWIEDALVWALAQYWEDKGGRPSNAREFEERAKAYSERLKAKEAREAKERDE